MTDTPDGMLVPDYADLLRDFFEGAISQRIHAHSGLVIGTTAFLDDSLGVLLSLHLVPSEDMGSEARRGITRRMFEATGGPLSTLSNRIVMAFALQLVSYETFKELDKVRKVRNLFAHSSQPISFETPAVILELKKLGWDGTEPLQFWMAKIRALNDRIMKGIQTETLRGL